MAVDDNNGGGFIGDRPTGEDETLLDQSGTQPTVEGALLDEGERVQELSKPLGEELVADIRFHRRWLVAKIDVRQSHKDSRPLQI